MSASSFSSIPTLPLPEPNIDDVKNQLREYTGGKVSLTLDENTQIASLCIEHVEKKNSFSGKMMVDLNNAVSQLSPGESPGGPVWESGKGLILYSNGDIFCSGSFLDVVRQLCEDPVDGYRTSCLMNDSVIRLRNLPLVSVAVVQGKAIGGGAEIMLATDFRLFTPCTEVAFVQGKMGITTAWGGGTLLKKLIGDRKALDLLLTGRKVKTEEALSLGLADNRVNRDTRLEEAVAWLDSRIKSLPVTVVRGAKNNILSKSFLEERQVLASLWAKQPHIDMLNKNLKHY